MVYSAHTNHNISIWKQSGFHLKKWLSPKNTKNATKTEKIKISKTLLESLQVSHRHASVPNLYKQDQNCDRQAGDKFHYTDRRLTDTRQTDRRQTDKQNFYCSFLVLRVQNEEKKSFSSIEKKLFETVAIYVLRDSGHIKSKNEKIKKTLIFSLNGK